MSKEQSIIGYKWLKDDMSSAHGDEKWEIGLWKEWKEELELCKSGFHACRTPLQSLQYIYGDRWFVVEACGEIVEEQDDKFCASKMRIVEELPVREIMLRFAIACAKNCLFRFEQKFPDDDRPRKAIEIAELFLDRKASVSDAMSAAESAARSVAKSAKLAAWSAKSVAGLAAESAKSVAGLAAESAKSAAWSAKSAAGSAKSAAESAKLAAWSAKLAAGSAEVRWQERKLQKIVDEYV